MFLRLLILLTLAPVLGRPNTGGEELRIAVASNFANTLAVLADRFESRTGFAVSLSPGSTGKHYAQIRNGAPFDAFFAADARRPRLLEEEGMTVTGTRFVYAVGKLVLWSPDPQRVDTTGEILHSRRFRFLAIANPRLAPYGRAAQEVLEGLGLWTSLSDRIVRGENIGQAFQYVASGNADLGFVALSQLAGHPELPEGSAWQVPASLYTPIVQEAVLLRETASGRAFIEFIRSPEARQVILENGYDYAG